MSRYHPSHLPCQTSKVKATSRHVIIRLPTCLPQLGQSVGAVALPNIERKPNHREERERERERKVFYEEYVYETELNS